MFMGVGSIFQPSLCFWDVFCKVLMFSFNYTLALRIVGEVSDMMNGKLWAKVIKSFKGVSGAIVSFNGTRQVHYLKIHTHDETWAKTLRTLFPHWRGGHDEYRISIHSDMKILLFAKGGIMCHTHLPQSIILKAMTIDPPTCCKDCRRHKWISFQKKTDLWACIY